MAVSRWEFRTPIRNRRPVDPSHPYLRRLTIPEGTNLVQDPDGVWKEYDFLPDTVAANADYRFGRTDRSEVPRGKGFALSQDTNGVPFETPEDQPYRSSARIYRGGHVYTLDLVLFDELSQAVTDQEPGGYGAYAIEVESDDLYGDLYGDLYETNVDQRLKVGDEIMRSGRNDHEQGAA